MVWQHCTYVSLLFNISLFVDQKDLNLTIWETWIMEITSAAEKSEYCNLSQSHGPDFHVRHTAIKGMDMDGW